MTTDNLSSRIQTVVCIVLGGIALYFFIVNVSQFYFVGDDAYISFRYARNLVDGYGLVWNPGEAVEGYTNFLWVLLMAASIFLGIPPELASNILGIASSTMLLLMLLHSFSKVHGITNPWAWLPLLILSLSASFTAWSTSGLETMFFTFLVFVGFTFFLRERERATNLPVVSAVIFALATLTRPDAGLFMFVAGLFYLFDIVRKKRSLRSGLIWLTPYLMIVGAHLLWRFSYYGFWLPNTFYAKVSGLWLDQGLGYLGFFAIHYQLYWFIPFVIISVLIRRNYSSTLFLGIILIHMLYLLYVGGDSFEFRFMIVVFPYLYWLIVDGMALTFSAKPPARLLRHGLKLASLVAAAGLLWTTHYASTHQFGYKYMLGLSSLAGMKKYADNRAEQGKFIRSLVDEGILPEDLLIGVGGAGALPYYSRLPTVDRRGLSDVTIGHMPIARRGRLGHERDAPYDYLVSRKVVVFDIFNQLVFPEKDKILEDNKYIHDGREVRVRAVEVKGRYLVFATFVSDDTLRATFGPLPILKPGGVPL